MWLLFVMVERIIENQEVGVWEDVYLWNTEIVKVNIIRLKG